MIQEQQKRAKMSAKERSEKKALTDAEIFAKSFTPIADDDNALVKRTSLVCVFDHICKFSLSTISLQNHCFVLREDTENMLILGNNRYLSYVQANMCRLKRLRFAK